MKYISFKAQSENSGPGYVVVQWDDDISDAYENRSKEAKRLDAADEYNDFARVVYWAREAQYFLGEPDDEWLDEHRERGSQPDYVISDDPAYGGKLEKDARVFVRFDGEGAFGFTVQPKYSDEEIWTESVPMRHYYELRSNPGRRSNSGHKGKLKSRLMR